MKVQPLSELLLELGQLRVRLNIRAQEPGGGDEGDADLVGVAIERLRKQTPRLEHLMRLETEVERLRRERDERDAQWAKSMEAELAIRDAARAEVERLREALRWYEARQYDHGVRARKALAAPPADEPRRKGVAWGQQLGILPDEKPADE